MEPVLETHCFACYAIVGKKPGAPSDHPMEKAIVDAVEVLMHSVIKDKEPEVFVVLRFLHGNGDAMPTVCLFLILHHISNKGDDEATSCGMGFGAFDFFYSKRTPLLYKLLYFIGAIVIFP